MAEALLGMMLDWSIVLVSWGCSKCYGICIKSAAGMIDRSCHGVKGIICKIMINLINTKHGSVVWYHLLYDGIVLNRLVLSEAVVCELPRPETKK